MKKPIFAFFFILSLFCAAVSASGQRYYLNNGFISGGTVTTCTGKFFDSNPNNNYTQSEHYSVTFCSGTGNKIVQIVFTTVSVGAGDTLFSYDGNSINSPAIDTITNDIKMPNGDGINNVYKPTIKCFPCDYHLSVFNRNGQLVFDTKNYQDLWDGRFNGNVLPVATYYNILTLFN